MAREAVRMDPMLVHWIGQRETEHPGLIRAGEDKQGERAREKVEKTHFFFF